MGYYLTTYFERIGIFLFHALLVSNGQNDQTDNLNDCIYEGKKERKKKKRVKLSSRLNDRLREYDTGDNSPSIRNPLAGSNTKGVATVAVVTCRDPDGRKSGRNE